MKMRRLLLGAGILLTVLIALLAGSGGALWWSLHDERGSAWLLARVPGVQVIKPHGSLLGDFGADALVWRFGDGGELRLVQVDWRRFDVQRSEGAWLRLSFDRLQAAEAHLALPKPKATRHSPPPQPLKLPVELVVQALQLDALYAAALGEEPLRGLRARVHLGDEGGQVHRIEALQAARGLLAAEGSVRVQAAAPMQSELRLDVRQAAADALPAWRAQLHLQGPLAKAQLDGRLDVAAPRPQTLSFDATVQPFAAWPVAQAIVRAQALDAAVLVAGAPHTSLSGSIVLAMADAEKPLDAQVDLVNHEPGPYSETRLPLSRVLMTLAADTPQRNRVGLQSLQLTLGSPERPAGTLSGSGSWASSGAWQLELALADVRPERLDARAWPMRLSGPLKLQGDGPRVAVQGDLGGDGVQLAADAALARDAAGKLAIDVKHLRARNGASQAELSGSAQRAGPAAPWQARGRLALADFDPAPWWPALRGKSSRIGAGGDFDLTLPMPFSLAAVRGQAALRIAPSRIAGVPLQGEANFASRGDAEGLSAALTLEAAGNRVKGNGRLATDPQRDHWQATVAAPALQRLAPLVPLFVPGENRAPAGSLNAELVADGRWPALQTRGELHARAFAWPGVTLREGDARWQLGSAPKAPLVLDARLAGLAVQQRQVSVLTAKLSGSADSHQVVLDADAAPAPNAPRSRLALRAAGSFTRDAAAPLMPNGWRGRIERADLQRADNRQPLLQAANVDLAWRAAGERAPAALTLQPGRADVLGGSVRWQRLAWQGTQPAQIDADVTLEPLQLAPLLARLQPEMGWSGDLAVGGRVILKTAPALHADVLLQRQRGDLQMQHGPKRRALGLSELRLAARADGPAWKANARIAGSAVGDASADVSARTTEAEPWPGAATPIQGNLQLRIADLGVYDPWLPVGWRLDGRLNADARLGGRLGAPEYTGRIHGEALGVGNFVEGARVHDGVLDASLDGLKGRIERFVAHAGDGLVKLSGTATFGEQPAVDLALNAERFRALARADRRVDISGDARLRVDAAAGIGVQGRMKVDEGLVDLGRGEAPELGKDVRVVDGPTPGRPPKAAGGPSRPVQLDMHVDLGSKLRVRGKGINTLLAGDVHITAPGGQLALDGSVRTEQGTYEAYGEKLRIERGLITFGGAVDNPRLDIEAIRPDLRDVEVGVAISGTAQNPRVRLVSTPEMSELDKLSWLTMGRSSAGLASDQTAILQRAALALLAGQGGGGGEGLTKRLGLDKISVGRGESGGLSDAVVSLGKQVSERFYVGYAQSLDATGGSWELVYKIARRLTLRLQTGEATAVDLIWTWLWG